MLMNIISNLNNVIFCSNINAGTESVLFSFLKSFIGSGVETGNLFNAGDSAMGALINTVLSLLYSYFYILSKFVMRFIDICEIIVNRLSGIENDSTTASIGPFAQIITTDVLVDLFITMAVIGVVLTIGFTIISIVKSEYEIALDEQKMGSGKYQFSKNSAGHAIKRALTAVFLMIIVPLVLIVTSIFSTTILNSFNNAFKEGMGVKEDTSLGGQVFVAAAYNSNKFRTYAENNAKIPIIINSFSDPYDNGTWQTYTSKDLASIYASWSDGKELYSNLSTKNFDSFNSSLVYKNNKLYTNLKTYSGYEPFVTTAEQYLAMADFVDYSVKYNLGFYVKDAADDEIDWTKVITFNQNEQTANNVAYAAEPDEALVYDKETGTISITYKDVNGLNKYGNDYYTIDYNSGLANATTPIQDSIATISNILGTNGKDAKIFKILERDKASINVVRWKTEKALNADTKEDFTVYELSKIISNPLTGLKETKAKVKVAQKEVLGDYYILKEEKMGEYYEYTPITIDFYNDGLVYFDELEPIYTYVTWPEKLTNDCEVIYANIDFDNFVNYDNWADALGVFFQNSSVVSQEDVASFSTSLIHPLGLIMSELFMGVTLEGDGITTTSDYEFVSYYTEDLLKSIVKVVGSQYSYKNLMGQIQYFIDLYNSQFTPIIQSLHEIEGFDMLGQDEFSVQCYVYKAYLASVMLGSDYGNYLFNLAYEILNLNGLIENLRYNSNSPMYDENGQMVFEKVYNYNSEYEREKQAMYKFYSNTGNSTYISKKVYNSAGNMFYTANELGELSAIGAKVPKDNIKYFINLKRGNGATQRYQFDEDGRLFYFSNTYGGNFKTYYDYREGDVLSYALYISVGDGPSKYYDYSSYMADSGNHETWISYFEDYYSIECQTIDGINTMLVYVYEPQTVLESGDSSVVEKVVAMNEYDEKLVYSNSPTDPNTSEYNFIKSNLETRVQDEYFVYVFETKQKISSDYFSYDLLSANDKKMIDNAIIYIDELIEVKKIETPKFVQVLKDFQANTEEMQFILAADIIFDTEAKEIEADYNNLMEDIKDISDNLEDYRNNPSKYSNIDMLIKSTQKRLDNAKQKIYKLKKYYLIYGLQTYISTKMSSDLTYIVNGHAYSVSQNISTGRFLQFVLGNKLNNYSLINSLNTYKEYSLLNYYDSLTIDNIYSKVFLLTNSLSNIINILDKNSKFGFSDKELSTINLFIKLQTGTSVYYTNESLKKMKSDNMPAFEIIIANLSKARKDVVQVFQNYINGQNLSSNTNNIADDASGFALLSSVVQFYTNQTELSYVDLEYQGIVNDEGVAFGELKQFLQDFGNLCFDLSNKSTFTSLTEDYVEDEEFLDHIQDFSILLNNLLKDVDFGSAVESITVLSTNGINGTSQVVNYRSMAYVDLPTEYKNYIIMIQELLQKQIDDYVTQEEYFNTALGYLKNYTNNRYVLTDSSMVYSTYLKTYLDYFKYNVVLDESFQENYAYAGYDGIMDSGDKISYYNEYISAFDSILFGSGLYFTELNAIQQKVLLDTYRYFYNDLYNNFVSRNGSQYEDNLANLNVVNNYMAGNTGSTYGSIYSLIVSNLNLLNLYNLVEFSGLDFNVNYTLADYRTQAMDLLVDFVEYVGESGASVQQRYLALLYIACADYSKSILGNTFIQVDDYSKQIVLELAGIADLPEERLVGLEYEVDFSDSRSDEKYGSIFIICTYNDETKLYEPFLMATGENDNNIPVSNSYSSPVKSTIQPTANIAFANGAKEETISVVQYYPVIAKGIFTKEGLPTAIRSSNGFIEYYRDDVVVRNASSLNIDMYYQANETISSNLSPVSFIINLFSKKSAQSSTSELYPRLVADSNVSLPYGKSTTYVYHLDNGYSNLNYMFNKNSGIEVDYLYDISNLNLIVLLIGTVMVASALIKAMFGLIRVLFEMAILFVIFPAIISTYVFDDSKLKSWKDLFIKRLLVSFGFVIGINFYFLVIRLIYQIQFFGPNTNISVLKDSWMFYWVNIDLLNGIAQVLFFIVAAVLLESIPKMINKILGGEDLSEMGTRTMQETAYVIQKAGDIASGYALKDSIKRNFDSVKSFVPGVLTKAAGKISQKVKQSKADAKKNQNASQNAQKAAAMQKDLLSKGYSKEAASAASKSYEKKLNTNYDKEVKRRDDYKANEKAKEAAAFEKRQKARGEQDTSMAKWRSLDKTREEEKKEKKAKEDKKAKKAEKK